MYLLDSVLLSSTFKNDEGAKTGVVTTELQNVRSPTGIRGVCVQTERIKSPFALRNHEVMPPPPQVICSDNGGTKVVQVPMGF